MNWRASPLSYPRLEKFKILKAMMLRITPIAALLSLTFCTGLSAQLLTSSSAANDDKTSFAKRVQLKDDAMGSLVREAEQLGWNIYRYETLSDLASYVLAGQTTAAQRATIADSIVLQGDGQWSVRYYSKSADDKFAPVADVIFENNAAAGRIAPANELKAFTNSDLALIRAKELVKTQKDPCNSAFKVVVLPAPSGKDLYVYQLRECFDSQHIPEGQHIRYEVSADGTKIVAQREFAKRCNILPAQASAETKHEELKLTNTMDPQPTELHIYLSLRYGTDIFLATMQSNLYWQINGGVVRSD